MISARHDSLLTRLGERQDRGLWRLWVEDTGYARLQRNNFAPGSPFTVERRGGTGLIIRRAILGSCHVSSRRGAGVLSYEAADLSKFLPDPEVRVRIHVGQIIVAPRLRTYSIMRPATEAWTIDGLALTTPSGTHSLRSAAPLSLPHTAGTITVHLSTENLVFATELIGNQRPARVVLHGEPLMLTICAQFLAAAGYSPTETPGTFAR